MTPFIPSILIGLALSTALAAAPADTPAGVSATAAPDTPGLGAARWGMTPTEVVAAFTGEAFLQEPPVTLPDGNVVGAGINAYRWHDLTLNVRFVFTGGKLSLVSLRTEQNRYVDAEAYVALCDRLRKEWGAPLEESKDDAFVDMRQVRWARGANRTDVKYIPGVVAVVIYPAPAR